MRLFEVILKGSYSGYFVEANDYNDAEKKLINYLKHDINVNKILDSDGSLNINSDEIEVNSIKIVADYIIR